MYPLLYWREILISADYDKKLHGCHICDVFHVRYICIIKQMCTTIAKMMEFLCDGTSQISWTENKKNFPGCLVFHSNGCLHGEMIMLSS